MTVIVTREGGTPASETRLQGRIVVPDVKRTVWHLDTLSWETRAWLLGNGLIHVIVMNGPHSLVRVELYIQPPVAGSGLQVTPVLVFSSDIPELEGGKSFVSREARSGTIVVNAVSSNLSRGVNAGSFMLDFHDQETVHGSYHATSIGTRGSTKKKRR